MKGPNWFYENRIKKMGFRFIAGADEAGRGALAGPVVVASVMIDLEKREKISRKLKKKNLQVRDSKLLTFLQREKILEVIKEENIDWAVGVVSNREIDKRGINWAVSQALKKAIQKLRHQPDFLLLDAGINPPKRMNIPFKLIIKGDNKVFSCGLASIIAKVYRDKIMIKYSRRFPQYHFEEHKGYGTKKHFSQLNKFGPSNIHRLSYYPLNILNR